MKRNILILICLFHLVSLSQDTINNSIFLNQIVLTGQYIPTHIDSSIYSVDIITKEDLESFGSQDLSSVLSRKMGVDIFIYCSTNRGLAKQTQALAEKN